MESKQVGGNVYFVDSTNSNLANFKLEGNSYAVHSGEIGGPIAVANYIDPNKQ